MGIGSRSEVKQGIRKGFVKVNGMPAARPELKVTEEDEVTWKGTPVIFVEYEYIMLNKPAGVISATEDAQNQKEHQKKDRLKQAEAGIKMHRDSPFDSIGFSIKQTDKKVNGETDSH